MGQGLEVKPPPSFLGSDSSALWQPLFWAWVQCQALFSFLVLNHRVQLEKRPVPSGKEFWRYQILHHTWVGTLRSQPSSLETDSFPHEDSMKRCGPRESRSPPSSGAEQQDLGCSTSTLLSSGSGQWARNPSYTLLFYHPSPQAYLLAFDFLVMAVNLGHPNGEYFVSN